MASYKNEIWNYLLYLGLAKYLHLVFWGRLKQGLPADGKDW